MSRFEKCFAYTVLVFLVPFYAYLCTCSPALMQWVINNVVNILTLGAAIIAGYYTYHALGEATKQTKISEINNAWGILARQGGGNMGKKEALEILAKYKILLVGIDVSSSDNTNPALLEGLDLSKKTHQVNCSETNFGNARLWGANFNGAQLWRVKFQGAILIDAKFNDADLMGARFHEALLSYTKFHRANLSGAQFYAANLSNVEFCGVDLTRTEFCDPNEQSNQNKWPINISLKQFKDCWVVGFPHMKTEFPVFPPQFEVILTDRPHKTNGICDGYYIEIKLAEKNTN